MSGHLLVDASVGTVRIGDHEVRRLGFGAMRISGARNAEGVRDRHEARQLVREIRDRGVNFFDAANIYGYGECEEILAEALHPYAADLLIGTKAGFRPGKLAPGQRSLPPLGRPEHIRAECDKSLRRLRVDRIDLYQVHVPDPDVPYEDTVGAFVELQQQGKIRHIGVSNVTLAQLVRARALCAVVSVQNAYGMVDRTSQDVLDECTRTRTPFLPHSPLHGIDSLHAVHAIAERHGATAQQVAIAWLLQRSPVMAPIPGTSQIGHAHANVDAAWLHLTARDVAELDSVTSPTG